MAEDHGAPEAKQLPRVWTTYELVATVYENYCPAIKTRQQTTWYENDSAQPIGSATRK